MDADLVLTILVMVLASWLPVGTARCVLSLVRAVVAGGWVPKVEAGAVGVAFYGVGFRL
ncbi:hypothetical protein OH809_43455 [Streptomyces sp. NBC_00873]|uniref:hypothetical protein n=1 Tax=unclassified Streptomyces TaxID=2593676 RepID=UPI00386F1FBD|nr:hypothetical protein OH809_00255 [Streptomyces sp. NBC_00873]WSY96879.1 hypothetical protein OH809_43455 [Streptomyces sp. NBC_00873]WTA41348.1 hypothetical protein OH821_00255 [Streptomyces sp. NBC_00842]WTA48549.1 hypothetical protein OH821_43560 [Streptomyces sp. NBC_00842]